MHDTAFADATTNMSTFVNDITAGHRVADVTVNHQPDLDDENRYGFRALITLPHPRRAATTPPELLVWFDVLMPGTPVEMLQHAPASNAPEQPRVQVNGEGRQWASAVNAASDRIRDHIERADRAWPRLDFGYNPGLPDDPIAAAWGCRAIVHQTGSVDLVPDRQGIIGEEQAVNELIDKLNGGLNTTWMARVTRMLRGYEMRTSKAEEFTLLDEQDVVVKANTNGSGGYLYVCAYTLATKEEPQQ